MRKSSVVEHLTPDSIDHAAVLAGARRSARRAATGKLTLTSTEICRGWTHLCPTEHAYGRCPVSACDRYGGISHFPRYGRIIKERNFKLEGPVDTV